MGLRCCPRSNTLRSDGPLFPALIGGTDERNLRDHLCGGVGASRNHLILRRRDVDHAREYEAGLSGSDSSDRYPLGDWSAAWFCSATSITRRTASAELTEQSQCRPVMTPSRAAGIFAV
jgi:hypothetical protein